MQEAMRHRIARHVDDKLQKSDTVPSRPAELEDWCNARLFHPLSSRLALALQHTRATPNMVSLAGFLSICAAAVIYGMDGGAAFAAMGLAFHLTWHVFDGADGDLARLTGKASALGEVIDGLSDHMGHLMLYAALGFVLADQIGILAWLIVLLSALARMAQATFYEATRRQYQWWIYRKNWLGAGSNVPRQTDVFLNAITAPYLSLAHAFLRSSAPVEGHLTALETEHRDHALALVKQEYAPFLRLLHVLNANYRTLLLGASMMVGTPLYFLVFEIFALSLSLCALMAQHRAVVDRIIAQLSDNNSR